MINILFHNNKQSSCIALFLIFVLINYDFALGSSKETYQLDFTMANKNRRSYDQVPKGELIWIKYSAGEPIYIYEGPLRGHGWIEQLDNAFINTIRAKGIAVYVDYFTPAKEMFYRDTPGYIACGNFNRSVKFYKNLYKTAKKNQFKYKNKFEFYALPHHLWSPLGVIGIAKKKRHLFAKHLWPNTNVYNVKSILDDPNLYTTQITNTASSIREYVYLNSHTNLTIRPEYKKRVYEFVASNSVQITLMLNAGRMDYADMLFTNDFYVKQLKLPADSIEFATQSNVHPDLLSKNDVHVEFLVCNGDNLEQIKNYVRIINPIIQKLRGNNHFWKTVLKQYFIDIDQPYISPEEFYYTKEAIRYKKELDNGDFDAYETF